MAWWFGGLVVWWSGGVVAWWCGRTLFFAGAGVCACFLGLPAFAETPPECPREAGGVCIWVWMQTFARFWGFACVQAYVAVKRRLAGKTQKVLKEDLIVGSVRGFDDWEQSMGVLDRGKDELCPR